MTTIFISGSERSGTTLLQQIICQDPETNPLTREASYFRFLAEAFSFAKKDFEYDTRYFFDDKDDLISFHRSLLEQFLCRTRARFSNARYLVLKVPRLSACFPDLFELLPDALFLLSIRDPKDAIASMIRVGEKMAQKGIRHELYQKRDIRRLVAYFMMHYASVLENLDPAFRKHLEIVRYEDLVLHPKEKLNQIRKFTGLQLSINPSKPLDTGVIDDGSRGRYNAWYPVNMNKGISTSSVGKYKNILTQNEIDLVENLCKDFYKLFDYT